jgi:hypothetical protein
MYHFNNLIRANWRTAAGAIFIAYACQAQPQIEKASNSVCIDLSQYYTAKLTDSLNSPKSVKENNLAALPQGRHEFAGVPFQIGGIVQLSGRKLQEWGRTEFPEAVRDIAIGRTCIQLHLLHGAGGVYDSDGVTIAKLVLHYADGSLREIEIKKGLHVRDWWGNPNEMVARTNSTLAWTGSNPALKRYGGPNPGSLRIYRTTFENPQPGVVVTSIDYVSTMKNSSPFLLGLTIQ